MWFIAAFILGLVVLILSKYLYLNGIPSLCSNKGFWRKYGILELDVSEVVHEYDILMGRRDITERDDYIYNRLGENEKFCGTVESPMPVLMLKDLDMVKNVYIKNFDHFIDRRQFFGAASKDSVLLKMLGNLKGEEWKEVRARVTPTFTTGKIRRMMESINFVGKTWIETLNFSARDEHNIGEGFKINVYECMSNYTVDVIAAAIFGLDSGTVRNPDSLFSKMANRLINFSPFQLIKFTLSLRFPMFFRFFGIDFLDMEALHFFERLLSQKLRERIEGSKKEKRNDFLQLLVEASKGEAEGGKHLSLTSELMSGQCLSFFFAGFRTTSSFLTFAVYALALHENVQDKLRKEIASVFKGDEDLDYDSLGKLVYLDMVICEVLRKFPATLRLERECVSEFHDPETGLVVPKGCFVSVPLYAIHNDKQFYDNPDQFDPEHFRPEKRKERNPYAFIPFGVGPRNCIGMRFALTESKAALSYLVHNFIIKPTENTPSKLTGKRVNFQIAPPENLELTLIPISNISKKTSR